MRRSSCRTCIPPLRSEQPRALGYAVFLARVTERPLTQGVQQFSLTFHAPAGSPALNGTSAFRHSILGEFDLFIVRVGAGGPDRTVYEACFSRHVRADVLGDDRDVAG